MILGGVRNLVEVYTNEGSYQPNIAPNNAMMAYHISEQGLEDVYITEKVETKAGWQNVFVDEEIARSYVGELQDFMGALPRAVSRSPASALRTTPSRRCTQPICPTARGIRVEL